MPSGVPSRFVHANDRMRRAAENAGYTIADKLRDLPDGKSCVVVNAQGPASTVQSDLPEHVVFGAMPEPARPLDRSRRS
jgi:hypothetical protein